MAPVAEKMKGKFSANLRLDGAMNGNMDPIYDLLQGNGTVKLNDASVQDLGYDSEGKRLCQDQFWRPLPTYKDLLMKIQIRGGRVFFEPFTFNLGNQAITLGGSQGIDGTVDYLIDTKLPTGAASSIISSAAGMLGGNLNAKEVDVVLGAKGSYENPKLRIVKVSTADAAKSAFNDQKQRLEDEANRLREEAEQRARQEANKARQEAERRAREEADRLKKQAEQKAQDELKKLKKKLKFP